MYLYRSRDRRLMEQTARDLALTLQRDYRTFNLSETTTLSNRVPMYTGWLYNKGAPVNTVDWVVGGHVSAVFQVLEDLLIDLSKGSFQQAPPANRANPSIWPVASINYAWIQALYAYVNPVYAQWATTNNLPLPPGQTSWFTAWVDY